MTPSQSPGADAACSSGNAEGIPQKDVTTLPPFTYEPLDRTLKCIRLLQVLPPENDGIVRTQLQSYEMKDVPSYVALSYTWDRDNQFEHIECNEMSLRVGRSVWDVLSLYQTRSELRSSRLIWIDAVCINQNDVGERNHQADQMRAIYSDAAIVIVWLGSTIDDAGVACELARHLSILDNYNLDDISLEQWRSVRHLLERPYWSRLWIVQEFILARDIEIWCGALSASSVDFNCLANLMKKSLPALDKISSRKAKSRERREIIRSPGWTLFWYKLLWRERHTMKMTHEAFSLVSLLKIFKKSQSTDRRDKVYGLLGLAAESSQHDFIKANYEKSVLEIAVDLVNFFCLFSTTPQRERSSSAASVIRETLGITNLQLAAHILRRCSWLHTRLHLLAPSVCILAPLRHVSTITLAGCRSALKPYWNPKLCGVSSLQLTNTRKNVESKGLWFIQSAPNLTSKAANPDLLRLLSLRSVPGLVVFEDGSMSSPLWSVSITELESLGRWMKVGTTYRNEWIDIDNAIHRSKDWKGIALYRNASCTSFVGTNGFYGITLDQVEPFDCAFVFAGTESTKVVLLLRPIQEGTAQGARTQWKVVGTAMLFAQELVSDATWDHPLPDERTDSENIDQADNGHNLSDRVYEGVTAYDVSISYGGVRPLRSA